ncbi:MAG: flavodoxin, partial [Megasphaera micronuciformis]|nr:flavodoxin [Megasphaera micronuciformis]
KNPESEARHAEAAKHPDEADLAAARAFAVRVTKKLSEA